MWVCEKCGTENEGYVCDVCGALVEEWGTQQHEKKEKSYLPLIATLCVLMLALLILLGILFFHMNRKEEAQPVHVPNVVATETPAPEPVSPAKTAVPQNTQLTETAELTTHAIVNDVPTTERRNIYLTNVEEYISETIRPLCNEIANAENLPKREVRDGVSKEFASDSMERSSAEAVVCVTYEEGTDGVPYARKYYYDGLTNEFMFAFIFHGAEEEHRLYFYKNSLIRYITPDKEITDNPTDGDMLQMADWALTEAYANR